MSGVIQMTKDEGRMLTDAEDRALYGEPPMPTKFGRWTFDAETQTLDHEGGYWIPICEMNNSTIMLDWIFQIASKGWATADDLGQLIIALREIFDPQGHICSMGVDHPFKAGEWLSSRFPVSPKDEGEEESDS